MCTSETKRNDVTFYSIHAVGSRKNLEQNCYSVSLTLNGKGMVADGFLYVLQFKWKNWKQTEKTEGWKFSTNQLIYNNLNHTRHNQTRYVFASMCMRWFQIRSKNMCKYCLFATGLKLIFKKENGRQNTRPNIQHTQSQHWCLNCKCEYLCCIFCLQTINFLY